MATGTVVRFDEFKGYGFVAPDSGGEDVFVHVNDLDFDKTLMAPGVRLRFDIDEGDRGLKAFDVELLDDDRSARPAPLPELEVADEEPDDAPESGQATVTRARYTAEVTELLLEAAPAATAAQVVSIRKRLLASAVNHGWVRD